MDKLEVLARAWIDCDPNRAGAQRWSGYHPDDTNDARIEIPAELEGVAASVVGQQPKMGGEPRWKWFLPRAEALDKYLEQHGYKIVAAGGEQCA